MNKRNQAVIQFMGYFFIKYLLSTHCMASIMLKRGARSSLGQRGSGRCKDINTKYQHPFISESQHSEDKKRHVNNLLLLVWNKITDKTNPVDGNKFCQLASLPSFPLLLQITLWLRPVWIWTLALPSSLILDKSLCLPRHFSTCKMGIMISLQRF